MKKSLLITAVFNLLIAFSYQLQAQCPTVGATTINTCDFSVGGEITVTFTDGDATNQEGYILFDISGGIPVAVSDPFGPVSKVYNAGAQTLVFGSIPDGTYLVGRAGCPTFGGFGILVDQTNELTLSVNNIVNDCTNGGTGSIDLVTSGGDAPYSYSWTPALPDQEDQTLLAAGSYDVTVIDADNCTFTLSGIVVAAGPVAQNVNNTDPTNICSGDDLIVNLDGSQTGISYEVFVNGAASGSSAIGTGAALPINLASGSFADGDIISVRADDGSCPPVNMNGSFAVDVTTIIAQNISNPDPTNVCLGNDLSVNLADSEVGVIYEVLINGAASGVTVSGTGAALIISLTSGTFVDGDVITVEGRFNGCVVLMTGSFTVNTTSITVQNVVNTDPTNVCAGDDLIVNLDNSEAGVTYEVLVNGVVTGATAAGTGSGLGINLANGAFADADVISVQAENGSCPITLMNGSFTVNITDIAVQNVTNVNPSNLCPGEDLLVNLDNSETGVTYEILIDGAPSGVTASGTGSPIDINLVSGLISDGNVITVEGSLNGCAVLMSGSFTINIETIAVQNVTNVDPTNVCATDDLTVSLDGSESGITYEILIGGTASGITASGTGSALNIIVSSGAFADGDIISVQADNGVCPVVLMNGSFTVNIVNIAVQNVTNTDPTNVCAGDDLTVNLDGSEAGVSYEILVNGVASGSILSGSGSALAINLPAGAFTDGDIISVEGSLSGCVTTMSGNFTVNITDIALQNITNTNPTIICPLDDLAVDLDGSETGVTYEVFINGLASGITVVGTGSPLSINLANGTFSDGDVITVEGSLNGCVVLMTGSFTVNIDFIAIQNVINVNPSEVCAGDNLLVNLDGSELGIEYEVLVNGTASGASVTGNGSPIDITLVSGAFTDGDIITVEADNGSCSVILMNGSFTVNLVNIAIQTISNTDPTEVCAGDDLTVTLDNSETGVNYEILVNGTASGSIAAGTGSALAIVLTNGSFADGDLITVNSTSGSCSVLASGGFTVNIQTISVQNVTNVDPTEICAGDDLIVNLDNSEIGIIYEVLLNGTASGISEAGTGLALSINVPNGSFTDGNLVTVQADNGTCPVVLMNGSFTVNLNALPDAGTAGVADACNNETAFNLFGVLGGTPEITGAFTEAGTNPATGLLTGTGNTTTADFAGASAGTYVFTYTVSSAGCADATADVTITLSEVPIAEAGSDSTLCDATEIDLSTLITPPSAANGTIAWTAAPLADGSFDDASIEQPTYTFGTNDLASGSVKLFLTVTGTGSCAPALDSVEFTLATGAIVDAGIDAEVCSDEVFDFSALASGDQPTASGQDSIRWETSGDGVFGDIRNLLTTYTPGAADSVNQTVTLQLIGIAPVGCENDTSDMELTISRAPSAEAGSNTNLCDATAIDLSTLATPPSALNGTITWTAAPLADGSFDDASIEQPTYTFGTNDLASGSVKLFLTVTGTGSCVPALDSVEFALGASPVFNMPLADAAVCYGANVPVSANVSGAASLQWTTIPATGRGTFVDPTLANTEYIPVAADSAAGFVELVLTLAGSGACGDVSDNLILTFNAISLNGATVTNTTGCGTADGEIALNAPTSTAAGDTFTFDWTGPAGFTATGQTISGLEGGIYTVISTSDLTSCQNTAQFTIIDPVPFTVDITVTNQIQCGTNDGAILLEVIGGTGPFNYYIEETTTATEVAGSRSDADPDAIYNVTSLPPGDYEVFVEDGLCLLVTPFTILPVDEIAASIAAVRPASCGGVADGEIDLNIIDVGNDFEIAVDDGTNPPTVTALTAGTTTFTVTGLRQGSYDITVTDVITNCDTTFTQVINEDAAFTINETITDISTCGGSDGEINLTISGLVGPATFAWTGPGGFTASTQNITGLGDVGIYNVEIENAGCVVNLSYTLSAPDQPNAGTGSSVVITPVDNPFNLFSALTGNDAGGTWVLDGGGAIPSVDPTTGITDFSGATAGVYTFTYTVTTIPSCTDSEAVTIDLRDFICATTKFNIITEDATCSGVQDGLIFLFLQNVSDVDSLQAVINTTDTLTFLNPGNGFLVELDSTFFSGSYDITLVDPIIGCDSTKTILIGEKQSLIPSLDITDPTCDDPLGQIQVSISGTFDFVLLDDADVELDRNTTGIFTDLTPATYGVAFEVTGSQICQVNTLQNIIISEPTAVSEGSLDVAVVEPDCNTNTAQVIVNFSLSGNFAYRILDEDDEEVDADTTDLGTVTFNLDTIGVFDLVVTNLDNPGICEPNRRTFSITRSGGFTAVASDKQDVICFGDSTGSVIVTLDGIASGFYSIDSGTEWIAFTSGNVITGLPAINSILVSDQPGTSECEISVVVDIVHLNPSIALTGTISLVTQASCATSEAIGEILIPDVIGGVAPYTFSVDGNEVTLTGDRRIINLSRSVSNLIITDGIGCTVSFEIGSIVSPNEVRLVDNEIKEINPGENCLLAPEGITLEITQNTLDNVTGPFILTLNKVDETEVSEFTLDINATGSPVFEIGPGLDFEFDFEKGARYRWSVRSAVSSEACTADGFINITAGAIIPSFDAVGVDAQCLGQSGSIELSNIVADTELSLFIQLFNDRDDLIRTFDESSVPPSGNFTIDPGSFGFVETGDYNVRILQKPVGCTDSIESEYLPVTVDGPTAELFVELVPQPQVPPGVELSREELNPKPTTRPDFANGSISIRLVSNTSALNYSAQIFLVQPLGDNNISVYNLPSEPIEFGTDNTLTFDNLLPGIYEIEYYDSFGCGSAGNKLVQNVAQDGFDITVDFDRAPFIPNIFTPGNNGINDEFEILNLPDNGAELIVTNRTGAIVFRTQNYRLSNLWDGGDQPDGVYFYQLTVDNQVFNGWVEILRDK